MSVTFSCEFGTGERVRGYGLPATVLSVRFSIEGVQYELEFDGGGSNGLLGPEFVTPMEAA